MKISLRSRLIFLLVISSIIFITIFTGIQVYNQAERATAFNDYRARSGAQLLKINLDNNLKDVAADDIPTRNKIIEKVITSLYESNIIAKTTIISKDLELIFATHRYSFLSNEDKRIINEIFSDSSSPDRVQSHVDKEKRIIYLYIPFFKGLIAKAEYDLGNIAQALVKVYTPIIITVVVVIIANIMLAILLSMMLIEPVAILNNVTSEIASGNLERRVNIKSGDELEELATTFNYMAVELKKMKQIAEDSNPLTKLPGNIVIRDEIEGRIGKSEHFLVIYCDLDNFKAFNDKYGIEAGDRAIKLTADIFKESITKKGNRDDFIGHEGGDDFILITTPDKAKDVADHITSEFDKRVKEFYSKEDLERGYIEAKSRQGNIQKFPVMSISLAGVTNQTREITSYAQVASIAAEVKKKSKAIEGSCFYVDRRKE